MHLIVIVVALFIERTLGQIMRRGRVDVFVGYVGLIENTRIGRWWLARPAGVAVILPPLAVIGAAQWAIATRLGLGAQLAFGLVGLLISLGPRDLWEDVYALADARSQQDHDEVEERAMVLCRWADGQRPADVAPSTIVGAVLIQAHERVLGVLLWYFVAGPTGALFYRLVRELPLLAARDPATRSTARLASWIHGLAAWIPARIVALIYAIAGRTGAAFASWRATRPTAGVAISASWRLLAATGRGALGETDARAATAGPEDFRALLLEALSLIARAMLILLALFAVFTLAGILR